jgi:hypothetical protein
VTTVPSAYRPDIGNRLFMEGPLFIAMTGH